MHALPMYLNESACGRSELPRHKRTHSVVILQPTTPVKRPVLSVPAPARPPATRSPPAPPPRARLLAPQSPSRSVGRRLPPSLLLNGFSPSGRHPWGGKCGGKERETSTAKRLRERRANVTWPRQADQHSAERGNRQACHTKLERIRIHHCPTRVRGQDGAAARGDGHRLIGHLRARVRHPALPRRRLGQRTSVASYPPRLFLFSLLVSASFHSCPHFLDGRNLWSIGNMEEGEEEGRKGERQC